jgi:hypothetical protein
LRDILTRLPHSTNWQIKDLTPEAWVFRIKLNEGVGCRLNEGGNEPGLIKG